MYNFDDDDNLQRVDFERVEMDVDWLSKVTDEVLGFDSPSFGFTRLNDYEVEVFVDGGRFAEVVYESDVDALFDLVKQVYPEFDWEV